MTQKIRVNREIYEIISLPTMEEFRATQIRNLMPQISKHFSNKDTARLYVSRQLERLEKRGLLESQGERQNRTYKKTNMFAEAHFILKDKRVMANRVNVAKPLGDSADKPRLIDEKKDIESNLTIALAEVDEYKILMNRSKGLHNLLHTSHTEAVKKAAALVAKLNVWTNAIELLKEQEVKSC